MKKYFLSTLAILSILSFTSCKKENPPPTTQKPILCGGFSESSVQDPNTIQIAQYAVKEKNMTLVNILQVSKQVVAGINYKMILEVNDGKQIKKVNVTVWEKEWENFLKITQWEEL